MNKRPNVFKKGNWAIERKVTKYDIAANIAINEVEGFSGRMSAELQRKVFGRCVFGKKSIKIDCDNQGSVSGRYKVAFGQDANTFNVSFEKIASCINDDKWLYI